MEMRLESDSIGEYEVPVDAYYGVQTLRAKRNFPITQRSLRREMILSLGEIKMACALTNMDAGVLDNEKASLIVEACKEVMDGVYDEAFIVDPIQGGAGTSTNMNANEVIANIANKLHGDDLGSYAYIEKVTNVLECCCVTGDYSMMLKVAFHSTHDLDLFIGHLQKYGDTMTQIVFSTAVEPRQISWKES